MVELSVASSGRRNARAPKLAMKLWAQLSSLDLLVSQLVVFARVVAFWVARAATSWATDW